MNNALMPEVRAYMSALGSRRTKAKLTASRQNAAKGAAARRRDLLTLDCTCNGGQSLDTESHKSTCPRGRLLRQREYAAKKRRVKK